MFEAFWLIYSYFYLKLIVMVVDTENASGSLAGLYVLVPVGRGVGKMIVLGVHLRVWRICHFGLTIESGAVVEKKKLSQSICGGLWEISREYKKITLYSCSMAVFFNIVVGVYLQSLSVMFGPCCISGLYVINCFHFLTFFNQEFFLYS